jgi:hypothetical protein
MVPSSAYYAFAFFLKGFASIISMTMADDDTFSPVAPGVQDHDSFASLSASVEGTAPLGAGTRTSEGEECVDNYDLTLDDNDEYSLSEKMVHYCGGHILQVHWSACKAVLAFYAGLRVSKSKPSKKPEMKRECLEIHYNAIEELDVDHFNKDAREFFGTLSRQKRNPCLLTLFGGVTTTLGPKSAGTFCSTFQNHSDNKVWSRVSRKLP